MRIHFRSYATLVLAVGLATCSDAPTVARSRQAARTSAGINVNPVFSKDAAAAYAQRAAFAALDFDHVRIVLVRPPSDTVKDTVITFTPGSSPTTVDLTVSVLTANESFNGEIDYTNNGVVVYQALGKVTSHPLDQPGTPQEIVAVYVGPGSTATKLTVSPKTANIVAPAGATFSATVTDANNAPISGAPVSWSSSDPTVATINATTGALSTTGKRGTATVTASAPTKTGTISDVASATVTLPAASITLVSGGGQTGKAGAALGQAAVVRVLASDGIGVGAVTVNFAAPSGGKVGSSSVTTDASGNASTSLTLGGALGLQSFAAAAGNFSVSISATATPGDPAAIAALSGSGQQDTVKHGLKAPFVAKVTDLFGNGVPSVTVSWSRSAGTGTLAGSSSVTGTDGTASMGYTLGATPGAESVTASVAGVSTPATFGASALSSGPSAIASVSGSGQAARIGQPLASPFVVRVTDDAGIPVSGATVAWTATNGTLSASTVTDAQGQSSNTMTLGSTVGTASAVASIVAATGKKTVSFSATVQAGTVAKLAFRGTPAAGTLGVALTGVQVQLLDAGGNLTAASNAVTIALGANPGQATLGGTLTRNASGGIATFNDLTINSAGIGYTLVASSSGVASVTSAAFDVGAGGGAARAMIFATAPPTAANSGAALGTIVIQMLDGNQKPVGAQGVTVTAGVRYDPVCELCFETPLPVLSGTLTAVTDANGHATFPDLVLTGGAQEDDLTFDATVGGVALPQLVSATIELAGPPQGTTITATGPRVFSVVYPQTFSSYPIAHVTDATGKPVPGALVDFTAIGVGCNTGDGFVEVATNASGDAALTPTLLPFSPQYPASCLVYAESDGIDDIETWSLVTRPSGTIAWTGITDTNWFDATNWTPTTPTSTDNVFIPTDVYSVATLSTGTTLGGVVMQSGGSGGRLDLSSWPLVINGDFLGGNLGSISTAGGGTVTLAKAGAGSWSGAVFAPLTIGSAGCAGGTTAYTLPSISVNATSLTVNCPLDVNGFFLNVGGDVVVQNSGKIILNQTGSLVSAINMTFQGVSGAGSMTSGAISVRGNITVNATLSPTPFVLSANNALEISGTGSHALTWGAGVTPSLASVAIDAGTGPVTFTSPTAIPVSGTFFTGSTGLAIAAGTTLTVTGAADFFNNSVSTIAGTMSIGANSVFSQGSSVTTAPGAVGTLNVTLPCTKSISATVNVGTFNGSACGSTSP